MSLLDSFIVNSDYPAEKIVWTAEGTYSSSNPYWVNILGGQVLEPISESLKWESILIDGVWTNDNWETQYPIGCNSRVMGYKETGSGSYSVEFDQLTAGVLPEGVNILTYITPYQSIAISGGSDSGATLKYRLWAYLMESDRSSSTGNKTAETLSHSLQLDTRLAHLNMISEQIVEIPSGQTKTIYHRLGFRPFCKIWRRIGGYISGDTWMRNNLMTVFDASNPYSLNKIAIDEEKITIYAEDAYNGDRQDFLIRIFDYAIPV